MVIKDKNKKNKLVVILGPTATGKTKLAVFLARKFKGEIVSADSRQVYKGMDIGTGKDLAEYKINVGTGFKPVRIPYHLIDVVKPNTDFNLAKFKKLAEKAIQDIHARGKVPFLVGGTGLYISALVENYQIPKVAPDKKIRRKIEKMKKQEKVKMLKKLDPMAVSLIDIENPRRLNRALEICLAGHKFSQKKKNKPLFNALQLGITFPKDILDKRIDERVDKRIKQGMVKEVQNLYRTGVSWKRLNDFGLEYRFISRYLRGKYSKDETVSLLKTAIHQFAKRQMTWFKPDKSIHWIKNKKQAERLVNNFLKR